MVHPLVLCICRCHSAQKIVKAQKVSHQIFSFPPGAISYFFLGLSVMTKKDTRPATTTRASHKAVAIKPFSAEEEESPIDAVDGGV